MHKRILAHLVGNAEGKAVYRPDADFITQAGPGITGRSVVIHADPDDYRSQPAGNPGKRIACGIIATR